MRLNHLVFKDTGSVLSGRAVTVSKLLFSLCSNSPVMWAQEAPSLHLSAWHSQGVSEAFHHLPSLKSSLIASSMYVPVPPLKAVTKSVFNIAKQGPKCC